MAFDGVLQARAKGSTRDAREEASTGWQWPARCGSDLPRLPRLGNGADLAHQAQVVLFGP